MNIFMLDKDPKTCAKYHSDKHVVKMILELTQLLICAQYFNHDDAPPYNGCYKKTHVNHPMSKWVRESYNNFIYTYKIAMYLCKEFKYRRNKNHACIYHLRKIRKLKPFEGFEINWEDKVRLKIPDCEYEITDVPLCMPDEFIGEDAIESYRNYYKSKVEINKWEWKRKKPEWY